MMQHIPGTRTLALIAGLLFAATGPALAQDTAEMGGAPMDTAAADTNVMDTTAADTSALRDTLRDTTDTTRDTTDTSGVQNPPGYRGMERDTTVFPPSEKPQPTPGDVEDKTTGTYDDSTWQDTTGAEQNPPGYRGYGRPAGDSAAAAAGDTAGANDTTSVGDTEPKVEDAETPRMHPSDSGSDTSGYAPESKQ